MSDPERTLWCGNLSVDVSDENLYELFLQVGVMKLVFCIQSSIIHV